MCNMVNCLSLPLFPLSATHLAMLAGGDLIFLGGICNNLEESNLIVACESLLVSYRRCVTVSGQKNHPGLI